jgi:hypothetical protein
LPEFFVFLLELIEVTHHSRPSFGPPTNVIVVVVVLALIVNLTRPLIVDLARAIVLLALAVVRGLVAVILACIVDWSMAVTGAGVIVLGIVLVG